MRSTRDGFIALGLLVSFGANALAGPLVLCTGAGGHISLEPAFAGCCRSAPSHEASRLEGSPGSSLGECGTCQDLPIPISPSSDPDPRDDQGDKAAQASANGLFVPDWPDLRIALHSSGAIPLPLRGPLANLRTTVLRF